MKNKQHAYSKLKCQLNSRKNSGYKSVVWSLTKHQMEYIENCLGYIVEPYLYTVSTRRFSKEMLKKSCLLRKLHFANLGGKYRLICKLSASEIELLEEIGIPYRIFKYKIILNP